ncbi:MAG: LacI family DNA-binding transcriptional regulator [Anaerolineae bacterium]|nr:LacI family DNA-binding transcriptional regulator [Anaerolineae bacterium]
MTVTLAEIAQVAGVSVATVSRVLSNADYPLKEETRQRILKLAEEMGYKPNLIARSLQSNRSHLVGVIVDRMQSPFSAATVEGIQDGLRNAGYSISIAYSNRDRDLAIEAIDSFYSRQVDGIIILNSWLHTYNDPILALQDRPFVFVNRLFSNCIQNCVGPGDHYGAQLATQHLVDLGHQRIGYINGMQDWIEAQNRLSGYRDVLAKHALPVDGNLIRQGDWSVNSGHQAAQELLALEERPTAIFAANDIMALGAIYAVQEAGLEIPADIAIVGYDDRDFAAWIRPALTTIRMPSYEMGQAAARLLLKQLAGEEMEDATQVPGKLVIRESCGANDVKNAG